ncbi:MAG TPA: phosphatase PAP2 family protein [Longilinea sp.]|nr:phosphatase PAP2 family protein [Longilinea sp.]
MDELLLAWTSINLFFQTLGNWLIAPMRALSYLGQQEFVMLLLPAIYWCWDSSVGFRLGAILMLSNGLNAILKLAFHSPRPYWVNTEVKALSVETSFGLPSGHAQNAAALWGRLAVAIRQKWAVWLFVIIIGLIGLSRVYLGMHFLSDVVAGWLVGGLLVLLVVRLEGLITAWLGNKSVAMQVLWAAIAAGVVILVGLLTRLTLGSWQVPDIWKANALLQNPDDPINPLNLEGLFTVAGTWWGMAAGYAWFTRKYGRFNAKGAWEKRALRFALGLIGLIILWYGLGLIFPQTEDILSYGLRFFRYALIGGWVAAGGPWLFLRLKLADQA